MNLSFRDDATEASMCDLLQAFASHHGLTPESADDMLCNEALTLEQRNWLIEFGERWDTLMENDEANVRFDPETGARIQYADAADASEHHLRMMGG